MARIVVEFEVVALVENLITLRTEVLIRIDNRYLIAELEESTDGEEE